MYSRVKRVRKHVKRDMYGMPVHESSESGKLNDSRVLGQRGGGLS